MEEKMKLRILETYTIGPYSEKLGERRYRVLLEETNIVVNVEAKNPQEALEKAAQIIRSIGFNHKFKHQP